MLIPFSQVKFDLDISFRMLFTIKSEFIDGFTFRKYFLLELFLLVYLNYLNKFLLNF